MADFDFQGALKAGYTNDEIMRHLASQGTQPDRLQQFRQKINDARARNIRLDDKSGQFGQVPFPIGDPERAKQRLFGDYQEPSRPGPAAPPKPELPWEMRWQQPTAQRPGMITGKNQFDLLDSTLDEMMKGTALGARGIEKLSGPSGTAREAAAAGHDLVRGAIGVSAPLMLESAVANPLKTAAVLGGAGLAQHGMEKGARSLGVASEYAGLAGDVAGIATGGIIHGALSRGSKAPRVSEPVNPKQSASNSQTAPAEAGAHGPIFRQFYRQPEDAIAELIKHQTGEAAGALFHPAVGDIDLIWGKPGRPWHPNDDGYGLAHIIAKHGNELDITKLQDLLDDMHPVESQPRPDRMELRGDKYRSTVRLDWDKRMKKWLLTTFDHTEPPSAKRRSIVLGAPGGSGETSPSPRGGPGSSVR